MVLDFLVKIFLTPENIIGVVLNIVGIVGMCLIFTVWKEKWWKSLVPIYGTFILYKHTWVKYSAAFVAQTLFVLIKICSLSFARKHITMNLFYSIKNYVETGQFDVEISISKLIIAVLVFGISSFIVFIYQIITYLKMCDKLDVSNILIKIGIVIFPDIFLLIVYLCYRKRNKTSLAN